jgi:hypothetical protein
MRFKIIVKATKDSEAGLVPEEKLIAEIAAYHEERLIAFATWGSRQQIAPP